MKEDFVTYDIAVKLKEKGFRERVRGHYKSESHLSVCSEPINCNGSTSGDISAPQIHEVLKWLRNQNIYVEIVVDDDSEEPLTYNIHVNNETVLHHHGEYFSLKDWAKCELAGIEYVLDNLI